MLSALSKNLLKSLFLPISTSFIKEPITGFYVSKCFTYLNKSSIRLLFLMMFFEIGSSLLLKLASFNLLLVRYRFSSPCISSSKSLVANRNFFTSFLKRLLRIIALRKVNSIKKIFIKRLYQITWKIFFFLLLFSVFYSMVKK